MFAAQTPESPVQVLDRQRTSRIDHKLSDRVNGEGRKSLVAAGRHRARWPTQGLKHINDTANIVEGGRHDTNITMLSALQAPSGSRTTYTVAVQATPPARSKPDGGVKVDIESLPGQNQGKPTLDDARLDVPVLPGVNQDTSGMYEAPKQVSPAEASKPSHFPGAPAITVNKPLPGQNQEDPIKGGVIPPSAPTFPAPATSVLSSIPSRTGSPVASQPSSTIPSALSSPPPSEASSGLINLSNLALSLQTSTSLVFGSSSTSSLTSFVTLTRSEQGKLEAPVPIAPPRTVSTMAITISSTGADATARTSTHAVAAAQSVSGLIASTTASIIATSSPTTSSDNQGASILHPTARTLLILFVILGKYYRNWAFSCRF